MLKSMIQIERKAGKPIAWGDKRVTVWSRVVQIHLPKRSGGLIWNRPVSVSVQDAHEDKQTLPIRDVTRQAQLWLSGAALLGAVGLAATYVRLKQDKPVAVTEPDKQEQDKENRP